MRPQHLHLPLHGAALIGEVVFHRAAQARMGKVVGAGGDHGLVAAGELVFASTRGGLCFEVMRDA